MNLWNLILFGISKTPERALAILRDLRPSQWKMYLDGELVPDAHYSFALMDAVKSKMLVVDIAYTLGGIGQKAHVMTRLKNDGSDSLTLNGQAATHCDFEFHSKPLKKEFVGELGFWDTSGEKRLIELVND